MVFTAIANQTRQGDKVTRFLVVSDVKSLTQSCILVFRDSLDPNFFFLSETAENSRSELNNRPGNFPVCCIKVK